eukprot:TRINITY_DN2512_c1_g3_i3.p1 TRINITY_DN2512_c1_g3~~TRINITY_DN2512_c1_g3_i3.p1  ORF type:complete len:503 (+),score=96.15 TRINITY_DN2512_c1_g3_i3:91-1509(+)
MARDGGDEPPEQLFVRCSSPAKECAGRYVLVRGELVNGMPLWRCGDGSAGGRVHWLFSTHLGWWMVAATRRAFSEAACCGLLCGGAPHRASMPQHTTLWQYGDGAQWHADRAAAVTTTPAPVRPLSRGRRGGSPPDAAPPRGESGVSGGPWCAAPPPPSSSGGTPRRWAECSPPHRLHSPPAAPPSPPPSPSRSPSPAVRPPTQPSRGSPAPPASGPPSAPSAGGASPPRRPLQPPPPPPPMHVPLPPQGAVAVPGPALHAGALAGLAEEGCCAVLGALRAERMLREHREALFAGAAAQSPQRRLGPGAALHSPLGPAAGPQSPVRRPGPAALLSGGPAPSRRAVSTSPRSHTRLPLRLRFDLTAQPPLAPQQRRLLGVCGVYALQGADRSGDPVWCRGEPGSSESVWLRRADCGRWHLLPHPGAPTHSCAPLVRSASPADGSDLPHMHVAWEAMGVGGAAWRAAELCCVPL